MHKKLKHIKKILSKNPALIFSGALLLVLFTGLGMVMMQSDRSTENRSRADAGTKPPVVYLMPVLNDAVPSTLNEIELLPEGTTSKVGKADIKMDTNGHDVIAADVTLFFNPTKVPYIEMVNFVPNITLFNAKDTDFVSVTKPLDSSGMMRLLVMTAPGRIINSNGINLGNIQVKFKSNAVAGNVESGKALMIVMKAEVVTPAKVVTIEAPNTLKNSDGKYQGQLIWTYIASAPAAAQNAAEPTATEPSAAVTSPTPTRATISPTVRTTPRIEPTQPRQPTQPPQPTVTGGLQVDLTGNPCAWNTNKSVIGWCYEKTASKKDCYAYNQYARGDGACRNSDKTVNSSYMCCTGRIEP